MDKSAENDESTPERRSVRRRLVQSTLFQPKEQEIEFNGGDQKPDKDFEVEGDNEDDLEYCGSQGKKTRKRKGKTTPQKTKVPRKLKDKSPRKTTPKKNANGNGLISNNLTDGETLSPPIPNLRLEAKLTAEENSRMFAGKQIHPFFSSWKGGKKNQDTTEVDNNFCAVGRKDKSITIGPIHVFEKLEDKVVSIDWSNWMFSEKNLTNASYCMESTMPSAFGGSVVSLTFDKLPCVPHTWEESQNVFSDHCHVKKHMHETSSTIPVILLEDCEDHQVEHVRESEVEKNLLERKMPYSNDCGNQPEDNLWTDKYQPKKAVEVCGNNEAVKFISEWLHLWHEGGLRAIKDPTVSNKSSMQDDSYDCYRIDSDSESNDEGDKLKNVLLVTGPIGSGKSAAIHACAMENGFKILENNASDCRNGTFVRQKFGEALESHCLNRSLGNPVDSQSKTTLSYAKSLGNGEAVQEVHHDETKVIEISDGYNSYGSVDVSGNIFSKERTTNDRVNIKTLILFEDVDIFFPEDRGFITAVQQIAEKAKGPVILTSNSKDILLPHNLNRLDVSFTVPSSKDLLLLLYTICAAEEVNVPPYLLEQLIGCCEGDMRKTIMHLQFWCQNKTKKLLKLCGPLLFDPGTGHQMLPCIIPCDFPSQLSELVEKEIANSLSLMEDNLSLMEIVEGKEHTKILSSQPIHQNVTDSIDAKKEAMLSRNCSVQANNEYADPFGTVCELSDFPGTPVSFARRNVHRAHNVVTSSDSEDDELNRYRFPPGFPPVSERGINNKSFLEDDSRFPSHISNTQNCINPFTEDLHHFEPEQLVGNSYQCSETIGSWCMNNTCISGDISCVPDSLIVPETEICYGTELLSGPACSGYVAETIEASVGNEIHNFAPVEAVNYPALITCEKSNLLGNIGDPIAESPLREEDSQNDHVDAMSRGYEVMDECSRVDFMRKSNRMEKLQSPATTDLVKESWKKLRESNTNLKLYVTSEKEEALRIVELANRMCKLISDADVLFSKCQTLDDISTFPCEEADAFSWRKEHLQMTSTIAQDGFCFYAKDICTKLSSDRVPDLTPETLASTSSVTGLGKLFDQDGEASRTSVAGSCLDMSPSRIDILLISDMKSSLLNTIKSVVPTKSFSTLKGNAFHEYLSSLRFISRLEASRLSESMQCSKKRRKRGSRHYLSSGALTMSPEDISVLTQSNLFGKFSSQSQHNVRQ